MAASPTLPRKTTDIGESWGPGSSRAWLRAMFMQPVTEAAARSAARWRPIAPVSLAPAPCATIGSGGVMFVPLTLSDFLYRAEMVYGARLAVVDEPQPPGGGLGRFTYAELGTMARSLAAALDELGVAEG